MLICLICIISCVQSNFIPNPCKIQLKLRWRILYAKIKISDFILNLCKIFDPKPNEIFALICLICMNNCVWFYFKWSDKLKMVGKSNPVNPIPNFIGQCPAKEEIVLTISYSSSSSCIKDKKSLLMLYRYHFLSSSSSCIKDKKSLLLDRYHFLIFFLSIFNHLNH